MDLQWNSHFGFLRHGTSYKVSSGLEKFLLKNAEAFQYFFFSLQPNDYDLLLNPNRIKDYFRFYDEILALIPELQTKVALHHTMMNLGSMDHYPREAIIELTNQIIERYNIRWVNEDLGIWNLKGKSLPYPMPPIFTNAGLKASIHNVTFFKKYLKAPLFVEFPGFSESGNFSLGTMDAFVFFKKVIEETGAYAVLDTGHILSYQWIKGNTAEKLLEGLDDALPFESCKEIHLSGCSIVQGRFIDFHHGVILDEQLTILDYLMRKCPNLSAVTFEDPKFTADGAFIKKSLPNFHALQAKVQAWNR